MQIPDAFCCQLTCTALVAAHNYYQARDFGLIFPETVADARTVPNALDS